MSSAWHTNRSPFVAVTALIVVLVSLSSAMADDSDHLADEISTATSGAAEQLEVQEPTLAALDAELRMADGVLAVGLGVALLASSLAWLAALAFPLVAKAGELMFLAAAVTLPLDIHGGIAYRVHGELDVHVLVGAVATGLVACAMRALACQVWQLRKK